MQFDPAVMSPSEALATVALDRESLPQSRLNIERRVRTNPFPWIGQFSPQLVEDLLAAYAPHGAVVLDPFVGCGTTLAEAARLGLAVSGSELNPAAMILARVYRMVNLDGAARSAALDGLRTGLLEVVGMSAGPLFGKLSGCARIETGLVELWRNSAPGAARDLAAALVVLCDFHRKDLDANTVLKSWTRLDQTVHNLPLSPRPVVVHHADARSLPFEDGSFDFALTSPPYINVHNYHQKFRRSVEAMDWNVLNFARSEIGSNRQNRANRFLTVIQYSLDMALALREMARTAKTGARMILVLGRESSVRGARFFNGELVARIALQSVGLELERRQERVFRNRYGLDIYEDILHFGKRGELRDEASTLENARHIARHVLLETRSRIPEKERPGIDDATASADFVSPSPRVTTTSASDA